MGGGKGNKVESSDVLESLAKKVQKKASSSSAISGKGESDSDSATPVVNQEIPTTPSPQSVAVK